MKPEITIRDEAAADVGAITEVTVAAFKTLAIGNHTEQFVIESLRAANALTLSLVAEMDGRVVGHIAFSPVTISDGSANWYGPGPVMANGGRQMAQANHPNAAVSTERIFSATPASGS